MPGDGIVFVAIDTFQVDSLAIDQEVSVADFDLTEPDPMGACFEHLAFAAY